MTPPDQAILPREALVSTIEAVLDRRLSDAAVDFWPDTSSWAEDIADAIADQPVPWRLDRLGAPVPTSAVDARVCPLCNTRPSDPAAPGPCDQHGVTALWEEVYRLRAVLSWLAVQDVYDLTRKLKGLAKAYGRASDTIGSLRVQLRAYDAERRVRSLKTLLDVAESRSAT